MKFKKLISTELAANTIAILALAGAIVFNAVQVREQNVALVASERVASADYLLKLSDEIESSEYSKIMTAIENGNEYTPIDSKGANPSFTESAVENYIGKFETVGDFAQEGVIDPNMAYQELSYDVVKAWCNQDIQKDIVADRSSDRSLNIDESYWSGFQFLANYDMNKDHETCQQYDSQ